MMGPLRMMRFYREHRWTHEHLSEYLDDELDPGARERVEEHVGMCPKCRKVLAELKRMIAGLTGLRADAPGDIAEGVIGRLRTEPDG